MPVPQSSISKSLRRLSLLSGLLLLAANPVFAARNPEPSLRIPLEKLGFQPQSSQFLLAGSSMLTLHYVDQEHLLLTFGARHLMKRLPGDPEDDQDRNIDAVLLEIPSGRILARTTWRMHDHGQYLWSLGHGNFLLRIRDSLKTFSPIANLSTGDPFAEAPFLDTLDRRIAAVILSPEADLLTVETIKRTPPAPKPKPNLFGPDPPARLEEPTNVQINFYRLHFTDEAAPTIKPSSAGAVVAKRTGSIAVTTAGYLAIVDQGHTHYAFDFHSYAGKVNELSPFDSNCPPYPIFVSHSEFIAFGCHTGHTMQVVAGFNMRGQEMWEQGLFGDFIAPSLVYAPSAGRFAFSRILLHGSVLPDQPISADEISAQSVVVYQTDSGKQLLHVECSPVERAGQNFTLSPDGLSLALIHADAIEIYTLPPLTSKDETAIKLARTSSPAESDLPVHFADRPTPSSEEADSTIQPESQPDNANTPTAAGNGSPDVPQSPDTPQPGPSAAATTQASGDPVPEEHRKPPTLYTLPGDKPPASAHPRDIETPQ
jgi:hypothetical protein